MRLALCESVTSPRKREETEMEDTNTNTTPPQVFSPECLAAVKAFRHAKPWRGNIEERKDKFTALHQKMCAAYGLAHTLTFADDIEPIGEVLSRFEISAANITLH